MTKNEASSLLPYRAKSLGKQGGADLSETVLCVKKALRSGLKEGGGSSKKGAFLERIRSESLPLGFSRSVFASDLNSAFNQAL